MMESLEVAVVKWAKQKGIFDESTPLKQMGKMIEEVNELDAEVISGEDLDAIKVELGDVLVTCIVQAHFHGLSLSGCLSQAYNKISKRTGSMQNGVYVKDE